MSEDKSPEVFEDADEDVDLDQEETKDVAGGAYLTRDRPSLLDDYYRENPGHTGGATGTW